MTGEEMERAIAFVLEQQAHLTNALGLLTERVDRIAVKVDRNTDGITALLAIAEIQAAEIRDLSESTRTLGETTRTLADRQREAEERGRQTDERLNVLINTVERYISEGRNGKT
jgi:methyl-accepting chemotaxis protein